MELLLPLLPLVGLLAGGVAVAFGLVSIAREKLPLIGSMALSGKTAQLAGAACVVVGAAFIVYILVMVQTYPDGLGHYYLGMKLAHSPRGDSIPCEA